MKNLDVLLEQKKVGELFFEKSSNSYGFNYTNDFKPISLIMPYRASTYNWKYKLHPIFDMNMPEGYLFEIFKNYLSKEHGYIDDFLVFSYLCSNMQGRVTYKSWCDQKSFISFDIEEVLQNDTPDTFTKIVNTFLSKNAISGVQPKSLALLQDKESLTSKEYIIKTWGQEYSELCLNEYFCLKAVEKTGVSIPNIQRSQNNKFLLVERFNYNKEDDTFLGFEEVLVLLGKNKEEKYSGSYEQIAKVVYSVTTDKLTSMNAFFKIVVMNYLLKNGDAHLKNFGILYDNDFKNIYLAPAYDIVNTVVYLYKDKPALSMFGKKTWFGKKELIKFGVGHCYLSKEEASEMYSLCIASLKSSIEELTKYVSLNPSFKEIGEKMIAIWSLSLDEKSYKEIPLAIIRDSTTG
jgi:serine/threonine-protein kinase HipA